MHVTYDDLQEIKKRLDKLEGRQHELAVKVATLAMMLAEREKPVTRATLQQGHGAASETWRAMQKIAFEIGTEFGKTKADVKDMKKRYGL